MRFTKLPVTIDAMRWSGSAEDATPIIKWVVKGGGTAGYVCLTEPCSGNTEDHTIAIGTMEGRSLDLKPGGWVIRGIHGEYYPCDEQVFAESYRPATEEDEES